jgi:hypothetical protein
MTKKLLFAAALLSLALASGCATGGSGPGPAIVVKVMGSLADAYVGQTGITFTATVTNTTNTAVTWSLSGTACTGTPNPCGSIVSATPTTGTYTAPATAPSPNTVTIVATSAADNKTTGSDTIHVSQITVNITPATVNIGPGLTQQFTAIAIPDDAPQTVTWNPPTCGTSPCGTITQDGFYTAPPHASSSNPVQVTATSTLDPSGIGQANVTVVSSRLGGNATNPSFAFRFSGYDNAHEPTALVGSFVVGSNAQITSGVADGVTAAGPQHYGSLTGSYTSVSNNQGKITLNLGGTTYTYTVALDAGGDVYAIESDSNGTGSGVIEQLSKPPSSFNTGFLNGSFVFGFTGADLSGKRVGYAGFLPMDGAGNIGTAGGNITPGLMDINDFGTESSAPDITGSYSMTNGVGTMAITSSTLGKTFNYNLYAAFGTNLGTNPLTVYAVSTDPIATNPAVSGTIVFQDPKGSPYNNATMNGVSVAALTGADSGGSNVSLTFLNTDGAGNVNGNFDQNDAGTILSVASFSTGYKYAATGSGRYTIQLLGNPNAATPVAPLPFVWYASGNGKGFLLDQSSQSVITGTLTPPGKAPNLGFAPSELSGTFAAATTSSGASGVSPIAANLLLTFANPTQAVSGTEYIGTSAGQTLTGTYTLSTAAAGSGPPPSGIVLTAPASENYTIYSVDTSGCTGQDASCTIVDFFMIDLDKTNTEPSVIFAHQ